MAVTPAAAESDNLFTVMSGEDPAAAAAGEAPEIILDADGSRNASATISNVYGNCRTVIT